MCVVLVLQRCINSGGILGIGGACSVRVFMSGILAAW